MRHPRARPPATAQGGTSTQAPSDFVVQFSQVISSSLSDSDTQAVQYNVQGIDGFEDDGGESIEGAEVYGALGVLGRPLPPETKRGRNEQADVLCVRTVDGLVPVAARDVRLRMQGNGPAEGTTALVGYGGGFHSLSPVADGDDPDGGGSIHVIYCPYDFDADGVAQKAHSIILDPTPGNENITIAHAEGMAITMFDDGKKELTLKNAAGDATLRLDDDGITMTAKTIVLSGGIIVGDPATAVALLPGLASQGSSKFFLSL